MIAKSLNAMIDGEQKELLKLEIHQLIVKAQYGTSTSRSFGNHFQITFKSGHSSPTYQRNIIEQTVSSPNFTITNAKHFHVIQTWVIREDVFTIFVKFIFVI